MTRINKQFYLKIFLIIVSISVTSILLISSGKKIYDLSVFISLIINLLVGYYLLRENEKACTLNCFFTKVLSWFLIFLILAFTFYSARNITLAYDADIYFTWGNTFVVDGKFSIVNFPYNFRGYVLSLLMFIGRTLFSPFSSEPLYAYFFFATIFFSWFFAIELPGFIECIIKKEMTLLQKIIIVSLVCYFQYGLIVYPLSDIYGAIFVICGAHLSYLIVNLKKRSILIYIVITLFFGTISYALYNIRIMYLFAVIFMVLYVSIELLKHKTIKKFAVFVLCSITGAFLVAYPQAIINQKVLGSPTIQVMTYGIQDDDLYTKQLFWGLQVQRYETNLGTDYPSAGMSFIDNAGKQLAEKADEQHIETKIEFISFAVNNFFDFVGVYGRHIFNMLDCRYPETFIYEPFVSRNHIVFLNSLVLYFAVLYGVFKWSELRKKQNTMNSFQKIKSFLFNFKSYYIYFLAVLLSPLLSIVGAVEIRFFLPVYILIYVIEAQAIEEQDLLRYIKSNYLEVLIGFVVFFVIVSAIWGNTISSLQLL